MSMLLGGVLYPWYESRIRGRKTMQYLAEYERNQWLSADEIHALQLTKLQALLAHCQEHVPYYARRWAEAGIDWRDLRSVADLQHFPVVDKDEIRANQADFVARPWVGRTLKKTTGGSTGKPLAFEYTRESYERRMAVMMRGYAWAGWRLGIKRLDLWSTELGSPSLLRRWKLQLHDQAFGRLALNCFEMTADNMGRYVAQIDRYRPEVLVGYTSALEAMATWIEVNGGAAWAPKSVVTAAEMLSARQRALIEKAFRAPVFHTYGCREFMLIGAECELHHGYHTSADQLVVEVADDDHRVIENGVGDVLITDLHNFGMPFVRYVNGDLAAAGRHGMRCACGRGLPLLSAVEGRRLDMLSTPDGRIIPGVFFPHLMKDINSIDTFQVRQTREDLLMIHVVRRSEPTDAEMRYLRFEIDKVVGAGMNVEFHFVDKIALSPSGKRRVTVRDIPEPNDV
jgi:phenylacetate-CoA ligase